MERGNEDILHCSLPHFFSLRSLSNVDVATSYRSELVSTRIALSGAEAEAVKIR